MIHLRSLRLRERGDPPDRFPFNVPVMRNLPQVEFQANVTFLVGENGSGKSTLLEAIAAAVGSVTVGSESVTTDPTLEDVRAYARNLHLAWSQKTRRGFFMRSEDFFGFARRIAQTRAEMQAELRRVDDEYGDRSDYAKGLAKMPFARELAAIEDQYGEGLDAQSHGESYIKLFQARFAPGGLYLLDEPEAPLSPLRQLSFLAMLHQMVAEDAQFIIATHSPIIMAYPGASILSFDSGQVEAVEYDSLEHVTITRAFLNDPEVYLRHLLDGD